MQRAWASKNKKPVPGDRNRLRLRADLALSERRERLSSGRIIKERNDDVSEALPAQASGVIEMPEARSRDAAVEPVREFARLQVNQPTPRDVLAAPRDAPREKPLPRLVEDAALPVVRISRNVTGRFA